MKNNLPKTKNKRLSFKDYGESSHHIARKVEMHLKQKADKLLDKTMKQKKLRSIDIDDLI